MKKLVFLLSILLFISCSEKESPTYKEMKSDEMLSNFFTDNELKDLVKIVDFFESEICLDNSLTKPENYQAFTKKSVKNFLDDSRSKLKINYTNQQKLYKNIDTSFFKEIWVIVPKENRVSKGFKFIKEEHYNINVLGKYFQFLKENSSKDEYFKETYKSAYISNSINFAVAASSLYKITPKEYASITRRLFFAIYYLTINENKQHQLKIEKL
ncbi:hypothetical protein MPF19_12800 [Polaribacter sp. Z014]|uniref:hypothetical protein n=1 Tax=unclassified Polaribacter TaxID=196858 RepID=UPI00193C21B4|nr:MULTISPECIES: hypothetical protein [unclassified Polaribacter]MCL7764298.1 hypothetical protein [Polaribacter sp. Z014]QVY65101.1 hypothetical protein JOP69_15320 [Polaribacter sp. Q13]